MIYPPLAKKLFDIFNRRFHSSRKDWNLLVRSLGIGEAPRPPGPGLPQLWGDKVAIWDPENHQEKMLLVPKGLAIRILVLGELP